MARLIKKTVKPVDDKGEIKATIVSQPLVDEMKQAYLEYAMSVIVSRALPDVRDGLKPVHRRILYAMGQSGLRASGKTRKSATVVGEVMGKYHPHGDAAIYDSMVRMAQDFSLRVPLIKGQGNFGCFTKDTKVKLVDGRDVSFDDLIKENKTGKKNYTYTVNALGLIAIAEIKNPRRTIKNASVIKVTLDNGEIIKCTPNHKFLLKDGLYKEAQNIEMIDSIMPLYQRFSEKTDRLNREGYTLIYQPKVDSWVPVHHLADNFNLIHHRYSKNAGRVRHHIDFNKLNNSPENLIRMQWGEHWKVHYENVRALHSDPEYRWKLAEGRNKYFALPETKEKIRKMLRARNITNWQNSEYREKMIKFLSEMNKKFIQDHPERRKELSSRATQTLTKLWQDPEYRAFMHKKIIKGNKNHTANRTGKLKFINICKQILEKKLILDEMNYNKIRSEIYPYGMATLWTTGLNKYFQNNIDLVRQEINKNHKVIKIEKISRKEDIYDLTIDGTHNFCLGAGIFVHNSIDGDSAAAMRYTECKMSVAAEDMLTDIEKNTVEFIPNYDGVHKEPVVLPSKMPNLLVNGVDGIAVGMATSIPPHNPLEIINGCIFKIDNPKATVEELMKIIPGPDLPTGAIIYNKKDILEAYSTGKGRIVVRGVAEIEDDNTIIITDIPYQVNKTTLVERIAELVQNKTIDAIKDLRDESNKEGIRIVVGLKKDSYPQKVLNQLYKHTQLQEALHINMLALVDGVVPKVLTLPEILDEFIKHRKDVVRRRTQYDLDKTLDRIHILEGLSIALAHIDEVIAIIKKSKDRAEAKVNLMKKFKLSERQTDAILDMRLHSLANLERLAVETELGEQKKKAEEFQAILSQEKKLVKVIRDELSELADRVDGERRTKIVAHAMGEMSAEDLIANDPALIVKTEEGYIKRLAPDTFRTQSRGGKGVTGVTTKEEDIVEEVLSVMTHDNILFFTSRGRCFSLKAYEIPVFSRTAKGQALQNFLQLSAEEKVTSMLPIKNFEDGGYVAMVTTEGTIKRVALSAFSNIRRSGIIAIKLHNGDLLQWVKLTRGKDSILLASSKGQAIRFKEGDVREMGRAASGVRGIRLDKGDMVIGMEVVPEKADPTKTQLMVVSKHGYGKRTRIGEYKIQGRGGSGIKTMAVSAKIGPLVQTIMVDMTVNEASDVLVISAAGQIIRLPLKTVNVLGRSTQGVRIMRFKKDGDNVVSLTLI